MFHAFLLKLSRKSVLFFVIAFFLSANFVSSFFFVPVISPPLGILPSEFYTRHVDNANATDAQMQERVTEVRTLIAFAWNSYASATAFAADDLAPLSDAGVSEWHCRVRGVC